MKKYFLAGMVAIVAFAMAAFAASFTVTSETLQSGEDNTLTCDGNVDISYVGYESDADAFTEVHVSEIAEACAGANVFVQVFNDELGLIWHSVDTTIGEAQDTVELSVDAGVFKNGYDLRASDNPPSKVLGIQDVDSVRVKIQG